MGMGWKRAAVIAVVVAGCGGPDKPRVIGISDMPTEIMTAAIHTLVEASATHDPGTVLKRLNAEVTYAGLWFPDPQCRRSFAVIGRLPAATLEQFATCLAPLTLVESKRAHPLPNVAIFTYEPGIEIEVMFDLHSGGVRWIGYAGRIDERDALPTVSQQTLEALRIEPAPLDLDPATAKTVQTGLAALSPRHRGEDRLEAWLKLCIDATGAISGVHPRSALSLGSRDAFVALAQQWKFKPFVVDGQPMPVCSMIYLDHPHDPSKPGSMVPYPLPPDHAGAVIVENWALGSRISGETQVQPDDKEKTAISHMEDKRLSALLVFCLAADGSVDWVQMPRPTGFSRYDIRLTQAVSGWKYPAPSEPLCGQVVFTYQQR